MMVIVLMQVDGCTEDKFAPILRVGRREAVLLLMSAAG